MKKSQRWKNKMKKLVLRSPKRPRKTDRFNEEE